jgi:hypothetical protein
LSAPNSLDDGETIHARHLHVKQDQVRLVVADAGYCLSSVPRFNYLRIAAENQLNALSREWFVIDD